MSVIHFVRYLTLPRIVSLKIEILSLFSYTYVGPNTYKLVESDQINTPEIPSVDLKSSTDSVDWNFDQNLTKLILDYCDDIPHS